MTQIICRATPCVFWVQGICGAEEIEYEPDDGCLTFQDFEDLELKPDDDDEELEWGAEAEPDLFTDEDDDWEDDDEDDWDDGQEFDL